MEIKQLIAVFKKKRDIMLKEKPLTAILYVDNENCGEVSFDGHTDYCEARNNLFEALTRKALETSTKIQVVFYDYSLSNVVFEEYIEWLMSKVIL